MPFRKNFFGEQIAQPGTTRDDLIETVQQRTDAYSVAITIADLYKDGDDEFKFGGTLWLQIEKDGEWDEVNNCGTTDWHDYEMQFDGFESLDEARAWLVEIGVDPISVTEVA